MSQIDCDHTDDPVCPHCGHVVTDAWELDFNVIEQCEIECDECHKPFRVTRDCSVSYSTEIKAEL